MSVWTHVAGAVRFDGLPGLTPRPNLGRVIRWDDMRDEDDPEETFVPGGSEGTLQHQIIEYDTGLPWLAVLVWGDLRDFQNPREVLDYMHRICTDPPGLAVRDGIVRIEVEERITVVAEWEYTDVLTTPPQGEWKVIKQEGFET